MARAWHGPDALALINGATIVAYYPILPVYNGASKQLRHAKGKGLGLYYFRTVIDQDGVTHRVHGDCLPLVVGDGVRAAR